MAIELPHTAALFSAGGPFAQFEAKWNTPMNVEQPQLIWINAKEGVAIARTYLIDCAIFFLVDSGVCGGHR